MKWASAGTLIAGTIDHQIKVFDTDKMQVQASVFTNHKVVTTMDTNFAG